MKVAGFKDVLASKLCHHNEALTQWLVGMSLHAIFQVSFNHKLKWFMAPVESLTKDMDWL